MIRSVVAASHEGVRLSSYLRGTMGLSSKIIAKLKRVNGIFCNGTPSFVNIYLHCGDVVTVDLDRLEEKCHVLPAEAPIPISVLYEDDWILTVNKPADMPTHPSFQHMRDSLASHLVAQRGEQPFRPVSRLDKGTSGVVTLTKNTHAAAVMSRQMIERRVEKTYLAITVGIPPRSGCLCGYTCRALPSMILRRVCKEEEEGAKWTETEFRTLTTSHPAGHPTGYALVEAHPRTGRTHQIRLQMADAGYPLLGDTLYGTASALLPYQALHACRVSFFHPATGLPVAVSCPPDALFLQAAAALELALPEM